MPDMNGAGPPQGTGPMTGRIQGQAAGQAPMQEQVAGQAPMQGQQNQSQQIVNQLRQMDQEQLIQLVVQLYSRLQEIQTRQTAQPPPMG